MSLIERKKNLTAGAACNAFVHLCSNALQQAESKINVVDLSKGAGYMNPKHAKLRVTYQSVAPVQPQARVAAAPTPKPKAPPKQLSMTTFLQK